MAELKSPSNSVVLLEMRKGDISLSVGTGVLYERGGRNYVATAWHNLSGRNATTLKPLSKTQALPDSVAVITSFLLDFDGTQASVRLPLVLPVENEESALYLVHPEGWPRKDVAVLPLNFDTAQVSMPIPGGDVFRASVPLGGDANGPLRGVYPIQRCTGSFSMMGDNSAAFLSEGDQLFVLGYPRGIHDHNVEPLWKRATVASDPVRGWGGENKFLIDCASREGMSGAPVVSYSKSGIMKMGGMTHFGSGPIALLRGIYVGRMIDTASTIEDRLFEAQIGTVWKREIIDEIIDAKVYGLHSSAIGVADREIDREIAAHWSGPDSVANRIREDRDSAWRMTNMVMKHLNGNADPDTVLQRLKAYADGAGNSD